MTRSTTVKVMLGATAAVALLIATTLTGAADQTTQSRGIRNIVLVHGAWADGSSWSRVIPLLQSRGLHVVAVHLPLTSFADDVSTVTRALTPLDDPVLLVGHSYGGAVITEAGNDPKVARLVYVAAYAPDQGQSAFDLATDPRYATPIAEELVQDEFGLTLTRKGIRHDFAQDLANVEKDVLFATQAPWSFASALGVIGRPAWKVKKAWFIVSSRDRAISPDLQRLEANRMHAMTITLPTSHVSMLADPYNVATAILRAAAHSE
jgi:pimeloyl-ACP methyl ester carboxylesterase